MPKLADYPITHAGIQPFLHPRLHTIVNGQTAVKYLRFLQPVRLDRLELPRAVYGRWVPAVPTHPAHLVIETFDPLSLLWKTVKNVILPADSRIRGEGLNQEMPIEVMEAHFASILNDPPVEIDLNGLETDHLRVTCDREHPVWPNHGECNGGEYNVPFGILDPLAAYGTPLGLPPAPRYLAGLKMAEYSPSAPPGMHLEEKGFALHYIGAKLAVGFSLKRPLLVNLGWDALGGDPGNRLALGQLNALGSPGLIGGLSGPLLRTLRADYGAQHWTGMVNVQGNRVSYLGLECGITGITLDVSFVVEPARLRVEIVQQVKNPVPAVEYEAWRLCWDIGKMMTAAAAEPLLEPGRNGAVQAPFLWAADGGGCLGVSEGAWWQVESYRRVKAVTGGMVLAPRPGTEQTLVIPAGEQHAAVELTVTNLEPQMLSGAPVMDAVTQRYWGAVFSCFRPEYGGFSNHAASVNCHVNQGAPVDLAARTRRHNSGYDPLTAARYSIERALLDGGGYSYHRSLYKDADPILTAAAGRIFQVHPNLDWLLRIEPGLRAAVARILADIGPDHLLVSRDLTGNSGSFRWSSNAMDVVGFGHIDAYVNAWGYRALRNAACLMDNLDDIRLGNACRQAADGIQRAYAPTLLNPATGWVAGWKSRDGMLHDYAFIWINGPAIAFGLLDYAQARRALAGLESLRAKVGPSGADFGLPSNLLPIDPADHMLPRLLGSLTPTFERYTDGSLFSGNLTFYLRALSCCGYKETALRLGEEYLRGLNAGLHTGGMESGVEFHTWEGLPSGYEGTFVYSFSPLYSIGVDREYFQPFSPEWWAA